LGLSHVLVAHEIKHAAKHGKSDESSKYPNQRPLTKNDIFRIPVVLDGYDSIKVQARGTNRTSLIYSKTFDDGRIEYIERVIETSGKNKPRLVTKTAWVVAPTGVESSLTRVSTPERSESLPFVNGRVNPSTVSKVVDENGEPMVVYHGTGRDIESFDAGKSGDLQVNGNRTGAWGSYFSPSSKEASIYAEMSGGYQNVVPVTMNLKNPYVMNRFEWGKHTKKSALTRCSSF